MFCNIKIWTVWIFSKFVEQLSASWENSQIRDFYSEACWDNTVCVTFAR